MMADEPKTNVEDAVRFLEWKRPGGPWALITPTADWDRGTPLTLIREPDKLSAFVAAKSGRFGVFYPVADVMPDLQQQPERKHLTETRLLHVDLDPPPEVAPAAFDQWAAAKVDEVRQQTHSPPPSCIVLSGNGLHLLWALDAPHWLGGADEIIADFEAYTNGLALAFGAKDGTWNANRVLRLPGSVNLPNATKRKKGRSARPSSIVELHPDRLYTLADFRAVPPAANGRPVAAAGGSAGVATGPTAREEVTRLDSPEVLERWGVPPWARAVIVEGSDPTDPERWAGDRSRAVYAVTCELVRRGVPPGLIVGILTDKTWGISAHVLDQKRPVEYAWRQAEKAIALAKAEGEPFEVDKNGLPYPNQRNIRLAVTKLGVRVRYDRFADRAALNGLDGFGPHLSDAALTRMRLRIEEQFKLKVGKETFCDVVEDAARRDDFHPVVDYLDGLSWDGTPRLDGWMSAYLQADNTEYTRAVGTLMLVAAVRRVRQPGCKFDEMVVLESEQGKAKSSALAVLAVNEDWFSDDLPLSAEAKLVIERTQGRWIVEAGELSGMGKKGVEHLKAFLARRRDSSRMAYGRMTHDAPRHFIVVGTTNDERYLIDNTGNRRFWPVRVGDIDLDALASDRDQLWAEAAAREAAGESIRLDRSLWQAAAVEQEDRRLVDPFVPVLAEVFGGLNGKVRTKDVWDVIGTPIGLRTPELERRLGLAVRELGFERKQRRFGGDPEWAYLRGDEDDRRRRILTVWVPGENGVGGAWQAYLEGDDLPGRQEALDLERGARGEGPY
jgi:hypothetical protein